MNGTVGSNAASAPIGVFDSGLGGLTVLRAIRERLPGEGTVYLGDTARVPYGPKAAETIRRYALEATDFLVGKGVKAVVVACNTATARALPDVEARAGVPVLGVVEPGGRAAASASSAGRIGVIGTRGTISSRAYNAVIHSHRPDALVFEQACPLFVPLVEEGWTDDEVTRLAAERYLGPLLEQRIDTLVLACTHYPLLKPLLARVVGEDVCLIDSAESTA
ncbi:MAG: glutamate racemase, partial [Gemmatimonadales bacterium]